MYRWLPFLLLLITACKSPRHVPERPPNVIIILTDDQGYQDLGCYGSPDILTPHLDSMAHHGIRLTSYYAAQAVCSASRTSLLTGCYPNRLGMHGALMPDNSRGLAPSEETLAELLKARGYATAHYGKWHLGDHPDFLPTKQGFDEYFGILYSNDMWPLHPQQGPVFDFDVLELIEQEAVIDTLTDQSDLTKQLTEKAVDFISRHSEEPFFLYLAHPQPHVPLFVSEAFRGQSDRGLYGDVIMEIDWSVGEIQAALTQAGIDQHTIVIYTSDNGPWLSYGEHAGSADPFREGKGTAWEGGHREPFLMTWPDRLPQGKVIDAPVMSIDILPTIVSLTNAQPPVLPIDGKNVWEVLVDSAQIHPQEAYYFYYHQNELHGVRTGDWKLYFPHRYRTLSGRVGGTDGLPVDYDYVTLEELELYNLRTDPSELQNVAALHPDLVQTLSTLADSMRAKLGDELRGIEGRENRSAGHRPSIH